MNFTQRDEAIASWLAQVDHARALREDRSPYSPSGILRQALPKRRADRTAIWVPLLSGSGDI